MELDSDQSELGLLKKRYRLMEQGLITREGNCERNLFPFEILPNVASSQPLATLTAATRCRHEWPLIHGEAAECAICRLQCRPPTPCSIRSLAATCLRATTLPRSSAQLFLQRHHNKSTVLLWLIVQAAKRVWRLSRHGTSAHCECAVQIAALSQSIRSAGRVPR